MTAPVRDARAMIAGIAPWLDSQRWAFVAITPDRAPDLLGAALGTFRESEGVSAIVPAGLADGEPAFARIVLTIHSDLEGVGLTAAVATALAEAGIACNVVAALHHDHLFVPAARGDQALALLQALAASARTGA